MRNAFAAISLVVVIILFGFTNLSSLISIPDIKTIATNTKAEELQENEAVVLLVHDGDTVSVVTADGKEERVRLLLIDAPESVHPEKPTEMFGPEASDYVKEYLRAGDKVTLEIGNPERDKYGRLLAYIWKDGVNFNQHMIEQGYARVAYVYEPNTKYLDEFLQAQEQAKEKGINIWSIEGYVTDDGFDMTAVD